jgi:hypothetical protein
MLGAYHKYLAIATEACSAQTLGRIAKSPYQPWRFHCPNDNQQTLADQEFLVVFSDQEVASKS